MPVLLCAFFILNVWFYIIVSYSTGHLSELYLYLFLAAFTFCLIFVVLQRKYLFLYGTLIILSSIGAEYPLTSAKMITGGARPGLVIWLVDIPLALLLFHEYLVHSGKKKLYPNLLKLAILLIAWEAISAVCSLYFIYGMFQILQDIRVLLFFVILTNFMKSEIRIVFAIKCMFAFMFFHSFVCLVGWLTQGSIVSEYLGYLGGLQRVGGETIFDLYAIKGDLWGIKIGGFTSGLTGGVYAYGLLLLFWFSFSFNYLMYRTPQFNRFLLICSCSLSILSLIFVQSKAIYISGFITLLTSFLLYSLKYRYIRRGAIKNIILVLILLIIVSPFFYNRVFKTNFDEAMQGRMGLNWLAIETFAQNPFTGIGLNGFSMYRMDHGLTVPFT